MTNISSFEEIKNSNRPVVIFGAGRLGEVLCAKLISVSVPKDRLLFCDNFKTGVEEKTSVKIISFEELCRVNNPIVFLAIETTEKRNAVIEQINEANVSWDIIDYPEIVSLVNKETDGGLTWNDVENTYDWTRYRETLSEIASWLDKDDRSVIDFSAGEAYLRELLPAGVTYTPTDYIARQPDFVVYDYTKDEFPDLHADVSVLCQMLYYVPDIPSFLKSVCTCTSKKIIVVMYARNKNTFRKYNNDSSVDDIIDIIQGNGFELKKKVIKNIGDGSVTQEYLVLFERI